MYKTRCYYLFFILFLQGLILSVHAQDTTIGKVAIASPNAASLGKYGDIPVGYHTGIPEISIPIYTVKSGSLQLPITLSYHAGGLKVQEQASWVGAGWTLNAGGVITRTVVGAPDDRGIDAAHTTYGHFSDYGYNSYLFTAGGGYCGGSAPPCPTGSSNPADDQSIMAGVKDGEPDLYFFNFNGHTGKFYFNDDRTPILVPEEDYKIAPIYPYTGYVSPYGIEGFIITTPDGIRYYFGKNQSNDGNIDAMEITTDMSSMAPSNTQQGAVSSWFLNKIISADGMDSIKLVYQHDNYSYYTLSMFPVFPGTSIGFFGSNREYDLVKNFIQGVRLTKILFANGEVDLNPGIIRKDVGDYSSQVIADVANTTSPALGSIQIADNNGFCKKDSFYLSYFRDSITTVGGTFAYPGSITSDTYRLKLDSVKQLSCDGSVTVPPYRFTYFPELVPRKLSFGIDHWGFYNGAWSNHQLIPTYNLKAGPRLFVLTGADRDAHWPAMRGGALQQITYPTGGATSFEFEPNDTWCSFDTYTTELVGQYSFCYDGSSSGSSSYTTPAGENATYLWIYGSGLKSGSGTINGHNLTATQQNDDSVYVVLPANTTYPISASVSNPQTGSGVYLRIWRFSPQTVSANVTVGGLRIKTITNTDSLTSIPMVTSYRYTNGDGSTSSGILYSRPVYVQELRNDIYRLVGPPPAGSICSTNGCVTCDGSTLNAYYASPTSIRPMGTTQGNHIGYNEVRVTRTGNGYTVYRYYGSNIWDNVISDVCVRDIDVSTCNTNVPSYPSAPLPFEYKRGELKYEGYFNEAGHILKDVWHFPTYVEDSIFTPGFIVRPAAATGGGGAMAFGTEYALRSAAKVKDSVETTLYDPTNNTSITSRDISYFNSPFHHQLTRNVANMSTGDSLVTNYKYAADFRIAACDTISNAWHNYFSAYTTDSVNFYNTVATCTNTEWNCKWLAYQQWRFNKTLDRQAYVSVRRTNYSDSGSRFATCLLNAKNSADALLKPILRLQDEFYNAPVEVSEWKNLNLRHAGFTRYDTSTNPIGFVYPGKTQAVYLQSPSSTFTNAVVSGNSITRDSRYQDETTFLFAKGNPQQVTAHDGVTTSYIWDYKNEQPVAKVINAASDQVAYTSFETDGNGGWTISSGTRDGTNAITGKQSYNLSNGACSHNGLTGTAAYIVSYWSKGSSYTVSGSSGVTQGKTVNGWTYFQHKVTGVTSVSVSGNGGIDELRLYPAAAQMTTYTYTPLVGMTSQCDASSKIVYYEYDGLGRLKTLKDQNGNILKTIDYHYKGQQ